MNRIKNESKRLPSEKVKPKKVVKGDIKVKKKTPSRKMANAIFNDDIAEIKSYILSDVIMPNIKKVLYDIVTKGIEMALYGGNKPTKSSGTTRTSYKAFYEKNDRRETIFNTSYNYDDIIFSSYEEADEVLSYIDELIQTYGLASVADYYDLVGEKSSYTDNKYGWMDISNARITILKDGYMIKFPKALPLE